MSGVPKRLHEESGSSEYHPLSFEAGQDARLSKVPRIDSRELDRRSPLHQTYRMPPPSVGGNNDSFLDNQNASDNRLDSRDSKDNRDPKENRDSKAENRAKYIDSRVETPVVKGLRLDGRGDDRDSHLDFKDIKTEKDGYNASNSHLNWKEAKEQHRAKRFPEAAIDGIGIESWRTSRTDMQGTSETSRDASTIEEHGFLEAHEAVGENKLDVRTDDKFKDKDRKKKDEKHRDWGERDKDRNERRSSLQLGNSSSEYRETREEKDPERWERKDIQKERERSKEREKDHLKKEMSIVMEKEGSHHEKESTGGSNKFTEQETSALELKSKKELDSWKGSDKDAKDKRKERDVEMDADRHEKRSRCYDKESEDGYMEGDGGQEREREGFSPGVQQRKRMLRPRGSPQVANREPRFRSRSRDNDEPQDTPEVSTVVYKVGECMQELVKMWKDWDQEHEFGSTNPIGPSLEIRIPAEYVTATNRQVRGGQLWGTEIYTDDSDLVAVLMHSGYCRPTASPPPSAIQELRATIRVLPPQNSYTSTLRNNVRSRAWGAAIGCSYCVEHCCIVKKGGGTIDLEPCLTYTSSVEPTLAPVAVERTMTTRAAASNALRQQRFVREVTIQYNLCNEPWIKYSISIVADKGLKKPLYTSARLKKGEVLYLETHSHRYELCFSGEKMIEAAVETSDKMQTHDQNEIVDVFRWSHCKKPLPQKMMRSIGIPLPPDYIEVLEENVEWEDVQWSQTGVMIGGKNYHIARVHFLAPN